MYHKTKKASKKTKISSDTKETIDLVINELSIIIGRKGLPKEDFGQALNDAFRNADAHVVALGMALPKIDESWYDTGAREALIKIKRNWQFITRLLIGLAIFVSALVIAGSIASALLIEGWGKWIILLSAGLVLFMGATNIPKYIIGPYISKRDEAISLRHKEECQILDAFVKELIQLRRK
ncbi:MAG: hypothetical protein HZR80_06815 [Candidatus Heimdallarchaeota archaeon]